MRTPLQWILPVFLVFLSACTDPVQADLDETHARFEALKKEAGLVNRELTSLNQILVDRFLRACRQEPSYVHRGNLDPEISHLIKAYKLNGYDGDELPPAE